MKQFKRFLLITLQNASFICLI